MIKIRIFHHLDLQILIERDGEVVKGITKNWSQRIENDVKIKQPDIVLNIPSVYVNDLAQLHADKWIEEVALHGGRYSRATHAPNLSVPNYLVDDETIQKIKSFSGDVSGVIGETLFAVVMARCFDLNDEHIAHFRAYKTLGIYPDFGIFVSSPRFLTTISEFTYQRTDLAFSPALPCEVKTITTISIENIKERLQKAINQIQNYWDRLETNDTSVICIALRNYEQKSYDLNLIWCIALDE